MSNLYVFWTSLPSKSDEIEEFKSLDVNLGERDQSEAFFFLCYQNITLQKLAKYYSFSYRIERRLYL